MARPDAATLIRWVATLLCLLILTIACGNDLKTLSWDFQKQAWDPISGSHKTMKFNVPEHWEWNHVRNFEIALRREDRGYPEYPSRFVSVPESNGFSYVFIRFQSLPLAVLAKSLSDTHRDLGNNYEWRVGEMDGGQVVFTRLDLSGSQIKTGVLIEPSYRGTWVFECFAERDSPEVVAACEAMVETVRFD